MNLKLRHPRLRLHVSETQSPPQGGGRGLPTPLATTSRNKPRHAFRHTHPIVAAAFEDRTRGCGEMRIGEGADRDAITARMVRGLPIDGRAASGTEMEAQPAAFHLALVDMRGTGERDPRGLVISADAERGPRPALAFDAMAQRHHRRLALGLRRERTAAAAREARRQSCFITCSALDTANAPGSSTLSSLTTPLSTTIA